MATIPTIRDALQARLATVSGIHAYDTVQGTVMLPAAIVVPGEPFVEYDDSMTGGYTLNFRVLLLVQYGVDRLSQDKLDGYLPDAGALSVAAAVNGSLGNTVSSARVRTAGSYGTHTYNGIEYLGCEFAVEVMV